MRRRSGDDGDLESGPRAPLLGRVSSGSARHAAAAAAPHSDEELRSAASRGVSPAGRGLSPDVLRDASTPGGAIRLTKRPSTMAEEEEAEEERQGLVLKDQEGEEGKDADVRELEVEVVAGAVAEAVAEAVTEAVQVAVHDAVQQAIEENVSFDVRANVYTLIAVTGVILFWRGVWNTWDSLFGTGLHSNVGSAAVGLAIMCIIRWLEVPLAEGLPGG